MKKYDVYLTHKEEQEKIKKYNLEEMLIKDIKSSSNSVKVNTKTKYQKILGFGGALTEASAYTLSKLDEKTKKEVLNSYYDSGEGIGYKFARLQINSCDFSLENYTYVEENDMTLETFSLDRDEKYVLPLVREVKEISNNNLSILASPWSPPAYMKTNGEMNNGGKIKPEFMQLWADYYVKYIEKMKEKNIDIWAVTVQNEPAAKQVWDSCEYTAEEERDFVKNYLGPTFHKNNLQDKKIIIWDHNRDIAYERAKIVLEDKEASKYIYGTGIHWYMSEEFSNLSKIHDEFPDKHIIFTEGCDAPIIVDTKEKEVYYNSSFYYIAHFSKFIKPNAVRVESNVSGEKLYALSCINEDNTLCIVIMNENDENKIVNINIDNEIYNIELKAHSIYTFVENK